MMPQRRVTSMASLLRHSMKMPPFLPRWATRLPSPDDGVCLNLSLLLSVP
uniref:Unplaced genomic scaffold supercont1.27, whole genome shotgun sequence n=1 Tax=Cryptococcus bacillisporus CA1280 TaxID=1296109 RepID=A0A0D0VI04_CRYGA|nr:hypothetical protein I312_06332 [Cryptococcus bacillisporus CA1280]